MVVMRAASMKEMEYIASLSLLVALTVSTVVLGAVRGYHFTTTYSQYVNQSTALAYAIVSSFHLWALVKWDRWDHWKLARPETDAEMETEGGGQNVNGDCNAHSSSISGGRGAINTHRRLRDENSGGGRMGTHSEALLNGHERYEELDSSSESLLGRSTGTDGRVDPGYVGPGVLRPNETEDEDDSGSTGMRVSFGRHSLPDLAVDSTKTIKVDQAASPQIAPDDGDATSLNTASGDRRSLTSLLGGRGKGDAAVPGDDFMLRKAPLYILMTIGWLNGTGNFCAMIGQPHTRGETQSLIMIAGIPAVLALSWIILGKRPNAAAGLGALVIICASLVSALPSIMSPEDDSIDSYWYSVFIYFAAQVFWSLEKVMEDYAFCQYPTGERDKVEMQIDVLRMFNTIVWVDFWVAFLYYPVQAFDEFGGVALDELPQVLLNGLRCTAGMSPYGGYDDNELDDDLYPDDNDISYPHCNWVNTLVFFGFCVVDYSNYVVGLYVIQRHGANLMAIAGAVSLPIAQIVFTLPIMGYFTETFRFTDAIALCLAVSGFGIYHYFGQKHGEVIERRSFLIRDLSDVDLRVSELDRSFTGAAEAGESLDTVGTNWNLRRASPSPSQSVASSGTGGAYSSS